MAVVPRGCVPPSLSPGCGDISCPAGKDANPKARGCVLTPPPVCSTDPTARHPLPKWGPLHPPWSPHIPAAGPPPSYLVVPQVQWGRSPGLVHPKTLQTTPKQHKPLPGTEIPQLQMGFLVWVPQNHRSPSSSSPQGCHGLTLTLQSMHWFPRLLSSPCRPVPPGLQFGLDLPRNGLNAPSWAPGPPSRCEHLAARGPAAVLCAQSPSQQSTASTRPAAFARLCGAARICAGVKRAIAMGKRQKNPKPSAWKFPFPPYCDFSPLCAPSELGFRWQRRRGCSLPPPFQQGLGVETFSWWGLEGTEGSCVIWGHGALPCSIRRPPSSSGCPVPPWPALGEPGHGDTLPAPPGLLCLA